ncbi:hypothetical protein B0H63DRAFT_531186 [Podospora didyma]|uniref:SRR1-like domain-containing protein n=1 Tax=Podospora didyma TaxID=330526 RepID=A0AAE0P5L8_9PEZI|nr:hypothetical protein B0H63DRAFT_531186 [Podospora didyma]
MDATGIARKRHHRKEKCEGKEVRLTTKELYKWGVPVFTKNAIFDLMSQLEKITSHSGECLLERLTPTLIDKMRTEPRNYTFQQHHAEWVASESCRELKRILESAKIPRVRAMVAFACGSLTYGQFCEFPAFQHALLLTLRDFISLSSSPASQSHIRGQTEDLFSPSYEKQVDKILATGGGQRVGCVAQAPLYQEDDKRTVRDEGVSVVDDPVGFLLVDDESVVMSINPTVPIRNIVGELAKPALMIWNDADESQEPLENGRWGDPVSPRLGDMLRDHYTRIPFPVQESYDEHFGGLAIYIRNSATAAAAEGSNEGCT